MDLPFDVVELPETDHPEAGDRVPDYERPLVSEEYWADAALSDLTDDGPVVLVFHPMDGAFPATYIWDEIEQRGWLEPDVHRQPDRPGDENDGARSDGRYELVGLSISSPYEHKDFLDDRGVGARIFSDPANDVAEQFDIVNDLDGMSGVEEPRPAVFVLDDERVVQYAWVAGEWPEFPDYDAVEAALDDL